jgi:hypothetical protein
MKTVLPERINSIEEAKDFLTALYNNRESFHPEDDAHDILWDNDATPTPAECDNLNDLMSDIYGVAKGTDFDPCGFILELDPNYRME